MKIALLSPVAWRTPPRTYGPWEQVTANIAEGLVDAGIDVTLFATGDSMTTWKLHSIIPKGYEEDKNVDAKVAECMHISYLMEHSGEFDFIHNHFDFLPLTYSRLIKTPMITTIHGFSSPKIIPVYKRYNDINYYVSISNADRNPELDYLATIYHGIPSPLFPFGEVPEDYLLFFGRIHPDKGTSEAIHIAKQSKRRLLIAGIIQDKDYFKEKVEPFIDNEQIYFLGAADAKKRQELLAKAYCLLHPISFEEPFGLSVAEAMMCGTPIIAFNRESMPELITPNETGFLVNTIEEAVSKVPEIKTLDRKKCRRTALSRFSIERMTQDYLSAYKRILGI